MMPRTSNSSSLPLGALVWMPFGNDKVLATVIEDRGPLGVNGEEIYRVRFMLESVEEPFETEVAVDRLELVAEPGAPPERRTSVEPAGRRWVGTYVDLTGRVAVVTEEMASKSAAKRAAERWVQEGAAEDPSVAYKWQLDSRYPGRYSVYRESRLGPQLVRAGH